MPKPLLDPRRPFKITPLGIEDPSPPLNRYLNVSPSLQGRFDAHVKKWSNRPMMTNGTVVNGRHIFKRATIGCTLCNLCHHRRNVVLFRGSLPCDVLFIGEAPGDSEDALGFPFKGPAGERLDLMWTGASVLLGKRSPISFGITNILGCIPRNPSELGTGEIRTPHKDEAAACQPRLLEVMEMADPQLIVLLGDIAKRFFPKVINTKMPRWNGKVLCLPHPARILHIEDDNPRAASLMEKKFILALSSSMRDL